MVTLIGRHCCPLYGLLKCLASVPHSRCRRRQRGGSAVASARRIAAGGFIRRHTTFTLPTTFFLVLRLGCWELIVPFVESELLCSLLYERTYSGAITLGWHPFWNSILYAFYYWYSVNTKTKNWCQIERHHLVVFRIGCYCCFLAAQLGKKMTKDYIQSSYILRKPQ